MQLVPKSEESRNFYNEPRKVFWFKLDLLFEFADSFLGLSERQLRTSSATSCSPQKRWFYFKNMIASKRRGFSLLRKSLKTYFAVIYIRSTSASYLRIEFVFIVFRAHALYSKFGIKLQNARMKTFSWHNLKYWIKYCNIFKYRNTYCNILRQSNKYWNNLKYCNNISI